MRTSRAYCFSGPFQRACSIWTSPHVALWAGLDLNVLFGFGPTGPKALAAPSATNTTTTTVIADADMVGGGWLRGVAVWDNGRLCNQHTPLTPV